MTDRPIIFSAPMVRALLAGTKTQTRRLLKPQPVQNDAGLWVFPPNWDAAAFKKWGFACQSDEAGLKGNLETAKTGAMAYAPGDRLYVREAFSYDRLDVDRDGALPPWYWSDGNPNWGDWTKPKPSIHMPRWASRITLTVTDVRVARLQDIDGYDAAAEGVCEFAVLPPCPEDLAEARNLYRALWNSLHGPDAWDANPWVVAVSFTARRGNIDEVPA